MFKKIEFMQIPSWIKWPKEKKPDKLFSNLYNNPMYQAQAKGMQGLTPAEKDANQALRAMTDDKQPDDAIFTKPKAMTAKIKRNKSKVKKCARKTKK